MIGTISRKCKELNIGFSLEFRPNGIFRVIGTPIYEKGSETPTSPFIVSHVDSNELEKETFAAIGEFFKGAAASLKGMEAALANATALAEEAKKKEAEAKALVDKAEKALKAAKTKATKAGVDVPAEAPTAGAQMEIG